ncbi:MAG: chromosome segregation protein SMC [Parvularculaceae bacterium]|nr:chromosome segregation protein SMC [Parvularculaceae bacterium]
MRFDRLRLCGFKSFVEPVEVAIEPGLTGVVGPNGCGKSNLVEGLRWLMGANSAKAMRASGMDEVIFAGTTGGRAARSWAEVTLEIDNSERRAPAQFNDTDTLTVSRRVVRKADGSVSNYSINGKECRARDVQMLFADASTGATSPALVRQGQISELINAKPTERRRFLEEAAGVTGLAARRHEAQLRLKAAADNLERLDDVIGELDVQSEQLGRQARKASKYKALTEDIKETTHKLTAARIGAAHRRHEELDRTIGERRTAVAELASQAASADREATERVTALEGLRTAEREAATNMTEATAELRAFENEQALLARAAEERTAALTRLESDQAREKGLLAEADTSIGSAGLRIEALRTDLEGESTMRQSLEEGATQAEAQAKAAEEAFESLQSEAAEARAEARAAEQARSQAERALTSARSQHASLQQKLAQLPQPDPAAIPAAEAAASQAREQLSLAESRAGAAAQTLNEARGRAQDAEAAERRAAEVLKLLEKEMAVLLPLIPQPKDDQPTEQLIHRIDAPEDVREVLAAALGDALHAAVGEGDHAWTDLGAQTSTLAPLPEGAEALGSLLTAPKGLSRQLAAIGLITDQPTDAQLTSLQPGQILLNRRGDLWRWDGYRRLGSAQDHLVELLAATARLKEVEADREQAQAALETRKAEAVAAKEAAEQASLADKQARQAVNEARQAERQAADRLANTTREQDSIRLRNEGLVAQVTGAAEALAAAEQQWQEVEAKGKIEPIDESRVVKARSDRDEARRLASQARGQAAEHRRLSQQRRDELRQYEAQTEAWKQRKTAAEARLQDLAEQRAKLEAQVAEANHQTSEEGLASELELKAEETKRAWERTRDALAEGEQAATTSDKRRREVEATTAAAREALAELSADLRAAREKLEETLREAEMNLEQANEVLSTDLAELRPDDLQAQLTKLERDRERLGAVNLLAADEQVQVEERLETLRHERGDCEDAASQLQTAVNSINREGRQRLLAAFDAVNGHFKELFTTLFAGGEAHLRFVDSDDPLAAGLEIFACPPGKKLQSLSLMSGGEQALTATALIFAAFRTNPAPICVLDEVDAPLDDANVDRFCKLLTLMAKSSTTRFLVVTHHPLTMSRMDRLFGVTMMERGVSRLFSLDLESAQRLAA